MYGNRGSSDSIGGLFRGASLVVAIFTVASVLVAAGCGGDDDEDGAQAAEIDIGCDVFEDPSRANVTQAIDLETDQVLTVTVCSNPTTGFEWELADISSPDVIEEAGHEYIGPEDGGTPTAGAAGQEVWRFRALDGGESTISLSYNQPWDGGEKGIWTLDVTVTVD